MVIIYNLILNKKLLTKLVIVGKELSKFCDMNILFRYIKTQETLKSAGQATANVFASMTSKFSEMKLVILLI